MLYGCDLCAIKTLWGKRKSPEADTVLHVWAMPCCARARTAEPMRHGGGRSPGRTLAALAFLWLWPLSFVRTVQDAPGDLCVIAVCNSTLEKAARTRSRLIYSEILGEARTVRLYSHRRGALVAVDAVLLSPRALKSAISCRHQSSPCYYLLVTEWMA